MFHIQSQRLNYKIGRWIVASRVQNKIKEIVCHYAELYRSMLKIFPL